MKITAILTTYNPIEKELLKNLNKLEKQVTNINIYNNSKYLLKQKLEKKYTNVKVYDFLENKGIAMAQTIGMKQAFNEGADFILQMDQDSQVQKNMVNKLEKAYIELTKCGYKIGLLGPQDYDKDTNKKSKAKFNKSKVIEKNYLEVQDVLSSGSLISKQAYNEIGGMRDELFIDIVDFEYCWRLREKGFKIIKVPEALLAHKLGEGHKKLLGFEYGIPSSIRHYYQFRNTLYMMKYKYVPLNWKIKNIIKLFIKLSIYPIIMEQGYERLKYMLKGVKDFFTKNMGHI